MHPRLSDRELISIGAKKPRGKTAYVINPEPGETVPALTWHTNPMRGHPNGIQYLSAKFSLPRQRWGHNARLPTSQVDIFAGLGIAADAIYRTTGIVFNPSIATVTEVHYAMDFVVGDDRLRSILDQFEQRQLTRHERQRFDHGVQFVQKQSLTQIYAKSIQIKKQIEEGHILGEHDSDALQASEGVLRVERRLRLQALERTQRRHGSTRLASNVLTPEASHRVMSDLLTELQFEDAVSNAESRNEKVRLINFYGVKKATRLIGFLELVNSFGRDFWRELGSSKRTYYDNLSLCKKAGVWALDK